jgi:reticulon-4-interacting protein 1, mitochondrial
MKCVMIRQYGAAADVLKTAGIEPPTIRDDEVLIRQFATSVNPIDCRMRGGYGRVIFSRKRGFELPLVLGRDVSGEVARVGAAVKNLSVGDAVYGVPATKAQGAYAELVVAKASEVVLKPQSLTFTEAAALPYVVCTVWDALVTKAGLSAATATGKRVFVQGGAGGIGSVAIQVLKAWGAYVATTCSKAQMSSVASLGADLIVDYETEDYALKLAHFDVALETIGGALEARTLGILKKDGTSKFVTLNHPILQTFDQSGIALGALKNLWQFGKSRRRAKRQGIGGYSWALFKPSAEALNAIRGLVEAGRLRPHIDRELTLSDMVQAHQYCEQGKANGKVVIRIR